ncbi:MAG: SDR family NAD(P)-dependent oxidoreductase, partial [Pelagibacteraceae bacterium]
MKVKYFDLENKVIFITGGGSGIGASIVEHFCEQGCKVFFIDINDSESQKVIDKCKTNKFSIPTYYNCDLLKIKDLQEVIKKIIADNKTIDVLVNN